MEALPLTLFVPLLRAHSISAGVIGVERAESGSSAPSWAHPAMARLTPRIIAAGFMRGFPPFAAR
jgi:hypothetical protein